MRAFSWPSKLAYGCASRWTLAATLLGRVWRHRARHFRLRAPERVRVGLHTARVWQGCSLLRPSRGGLQVACAVPGAEPSGGDSFYSLTPADLAEMQEVAREALADPDPDYDYAV